MQIIANCNFLSLTLLILEWHKISRKQRGEGVTFTYFSLQKENKRNTKGSGTKMTKNTFVQYLNSPFGMELGNSNEN